MNRTIIFGLLIALGATLHAQTIKLHGQVFDSGGQPVANAVVELVRKGVADTTGSDGGFSIIRPAVSIRHISASSTESMRLYKGILEYRVSRPSPVKIEVFDLKGNLLKKELVPKAQPGIHYVNIGFYPLSNQVLVVNASIGPLTRTFRCLPVQKKVSGRNVTITHSLSATGVLAKTAAVIDTLKVTAEGYSTEKIDLSSYDTTVNVTLSDATTVYNPCPTDGSPCKVLPFGDSITRGVKSSDDGGYRSALFRLVVAAKQKMTFTGSVANGPTTVAGQPFPRSHEGHPGWTIDPGYNMISSSYSGISKLVPSPALDETPHIILLMIGTNDLFARETDNMATRLEALLDKIELNAPDALIVLAQITPLSNANAALTAFNKRIPEIVQSHAAKGRHIIGVDMSKLPVNQLSDGTHPNDRGYAYMADIWYAAIKDLLPE